VSKEDSKEDEEEGDAPPPPPPTQKIEVPVLRYVSTSHPDARSIENCVMRYELHGVSGRVLQSGEPVLVPHVSSEDHIHFLHGRLRSPHVKIAGSYCAVPLKDNVTGEVYGVLAIDTLLDGRELRQQHVECLNQIAATMEVAREPHAQKERERKERERIEAEERAAEEAASRAAAEEEERVRREQEAAEAGEGEGAE
jgi:GAF domain-containing protein